MNIISKKKCIPCQGGIAPLEHKEINTYMSQLENGWKVHMNNTHLISRKSGASVLQEFRNFTWKVADCEELSGITHR